MYNFAIPALLKAYIDHIVRVGITVSTDNKGLLTGKCADIILASGGDFSPDLQSKSMIKPAAIFVRCWPGSASPT